MFPILAVKIDGQEETGFIQKQRIHPDGERPAMLILSGKMFTNYFICNRKEAPIWTISTFDPRFFANASYPFIAASGRVTTPSGLAAFNPPMVHVLSSSKQSNFLFGGMTGS